MKTNRIIAFIAIATVVFSLFGTPCNAQNVELVSGEEYVNMYGQRRAMVKMCMCDVVSGIHVKHKYAMHLLFENENWVIDDFQDYDEPSDVEMMRLNLERCKDCGKE